MTVIGVRFRTAGKIYYFDPAGRDIKTGDHVIVETARGIEYGYVVLGNREVEDAKVVPPLKPVIRMATEEDRAVETRNKEKEREAFKICQEKIRKHKLEMKLIDAEYTFDNNKVPVGVYPCIHQDGKGTESFTESNQDFRCLRPTDVLPEKRGRDL